MYDIAAITFVGLVRESNEDCVSINGRRAREGEVLRHSVEASGVVALVADGMGGHARGEIASDIVLRKLEHSIGSTLEPHDLVSAIKTANRAVYDLASSNPEYRGMGATLVGVLINETNCIYFNVGDSRAYRWRGGVLQQMSIDHVPPSPRGHARSHAVSQSLGGAPYFREVTPAVGSFDLYIGDRVMLCSDGLTDVLNESEIGAGLSSGSPEYCVTQLLDQVVSGGAPDNVTIIVIAFS